MWKERPGDMGYNSKERKETKGKPREMEPCVGEAGSGSGGERKCKGWWVEWWQHRRQGWAWLPAVRSFPPPDFPGPAGYSASLCLDCPLFPSSSSYLLIFSKFGSGITLLGRF